MTDTSLSTPERPDVIIVDDVAKRFMIRKDNSLKERIVGLGRGRAHRDDFWALNGVSFSLQAGTTVGLIGHNGSGKSTLLKVIGGILDPTRGTVSMRGRIAALLELGAGFHPDLTGRENVYLNASILGLSKEEASARFDDILQFSGIGEFIDTQVKFYSSGMYVRLAFAVAINTDPDILLVDEVLAVGDEAFQRKCLDKIRQFQQEGRTIVLVTHSLGQVLELCDRAIVLDHGRIACDGEPREAVAVMRDLLEERRLEDEAAREQPPAPVVRVAAVAANAVGRSADEAIDPGDDLEIHIDLDASEPIEDWFLGLQIDSALGQVVYGTTTKRLGAQLGTLDGPRRLRLLLRDVRFGPGKYFVSASIIEPSGRHQHDALQAASFNASDDGSAVGVLHASPELTELRG